MCMCVYACVYVILTISMRCYFTFQCIIYISATQMWCFARFLPLMIGQKIPEDDDSWINFLLLRDIMDYILAPVLGPDCVGYLKSQIKDHHESFKVLYPGCSIIPKMHYLIHYPECVER